MRSKAGWRAPRRSSSGAIFSSALSPIFGIDAWPATPSVVSVKRKTPFSAHADAVERSSPNGKTVPRALVEQVVAADEVGVVLADPDRALARRRSPRRRRTTTSRSPRAGRQPARASVERGGDLGGGLGLHVQRAAAPELRRRRGRPTTGRAASPTASASTVSTCESRHSDRPVGRRRAGARRGSGAARRAPSSSTSKPASRSSAARSSCGARSLPGGLTVLKRIRRWRSSVVSCSRSAPIRSGYASASAAVAIPATSSTAAIARTSWTSDRPPGQARAEQRAGDRRGGAVGRDARDRARR